MDMSLIHTPSALPAPRPRSGNTALRVAPLDLTDPASIAAFVLAWDGPLHVLVNNAGVMASPERRTERGWELQFALDPDGARRLWDLSEKLLAKA